jgi:ADP-heptose:LPS heptosyltransferase
LVRVVVGVRSLTIRTPLSQLFEFCEIKAGHVPSADGAAASSRAAVRGGGAVAAPSDPVYGAVATGSCRCRAGGGIGDVLMCTPVLRELKRRRTGCRIRFYTDFPSLVSGLPYVDEVMPKAATRHNVVFLEYENALPPRVHLVQIFADCLGLRVRDVQPDCVIDPALVERFRAAWRDLARPHIILSRHASKWTPNKEWPDFHWAELIGRLVRNAGVIEIGGAVETATENFGANYVDLRGRTSLGEFSAAIAAGDLHIGPVFAPVHIAAAAGKRSVVIIGGYEDPSNTAYPGNIGLSTPVACSPCWLRTPCPHDRKCLNVISPRQVEEAALSLWRNISAPCEPEPRLAAAKGKNVPLRY